MCTHAYAFIVIAHDTLGVRRSDALCPGAHAPMHMYVRICTNALMHMHPCMCMHLCTHVYAPVHMHPCIYICRHTPMHMPSSSLLPRWVTVAQTRPALVRMHPCICTHAYAPIHMQLQCTHACARMHMYPCICTHDPLQMPSSSLLARWVTIAQTRPALVCMHPMHMHACICTNAPMHMHQCTCICTHAYASNCMCTHACAPVHMPSPSLLTRWVAVAQTRSALVRMHPCICTYAYVPYALMHMHPCICTHACACTCAPMCMHPHICTHACEDIHPCICLPHPCWHAG